MESFLKLKADKQIKACFHWNTSDTFFVHIY